MTVYTGIDFHKRTSTVSFIKDNGGYETKTILSENLVSYLSNRKELLVGIEASCGVNYVVDKLKALGIQVKIINPNKFRGVGIGRKKSDKKDAEAIAECLKVSFIPEVYHKSLGARRVKSLLRVREHYVQSRVNLTNHVRGILREYGIKINAGAESFWEDIGAKLTELDFELLRDHLRDMVYQARDLHKKEKLVEESLGLQLKGDLQVKHLMTIPGVGIMTAAAVIAVGDNLDRFTNSRHFASYIGLTPSERSSGDKKIMGSITKAGQEMLRRYLIHGARTVLKYSNDKSKEPIRRWAHNLRKRVGMNKATVALAHRMARICFRVAIEGRDYRPII